MTFIADKPLITTEKRPPPLYQLPGSGDWITLADVKRISVFDAYKENKPGISVITQGAASMMLFSGGGGESEIWHRIECETIEEARELRDRIAAARNAL